MIVGLGVTGLGCGERAPGPTGIEPAAAANGVLVSDVESRLRAELIQADREFERDVRNRRLEGWLEAFADDAAVLPADGPITTGEEAIRDLFAPLFADPTFDMTWTPAGSEVSSSGDLGYTFGVWKTSAGSPDNVEESEGKYVTIWRRGDDGRWRVALDMGNTQPQSRAAD